jgi:glycosyltransferase involved in cell wall biosynthesis
MSEPTITIGLPVFNGEARLSEAIRSLLSQTFDDFIIVASDNSSADRSADILAEFARSDRRVVVHRHERNRGAAWNFNFVASKAHSRFFMWAAHDDLWRSDCLSLFVNSMEDQPDAALVYCHAVPIGNHNQPVRAPCAGFANMADPPAERLKRIVGSWEIHSAVCGMYRTEMLKRTRLFQPCLASDIVLLAELAVLGKTVEIEDECAFKRIPEPESAYRSRAEQLRYVSDPSAKHRVPELIGAHVTREVVRGILNLPIPLSSRVALAGVAWKTYMKRLWLTDVKDAIRRRAGDRFWRMLRSGLRLT